MASSDGWMRDAAPRASVAAARIEEMLGLLESMTEPKARARLLLEVATSLRDDLGDTAQAIDALLEAFGADPRHDPILDALEPLVTAENRWSEVLESTRLLAQKETDRERTIALSETMARWLTLYVPQPELARQWIERIRQLDATHPLVHMVQAAVSREHGDYKRELEALDRAVLSTRRADERARIHLLMAARYGDDRTKNRAEAKKHYAAAHKLFPESMEPLRGLERIAVEEEDKVALAEVLRKQADTDVDDEEKVQILLRLARIEEREFRKPELAAKTLERVIPLASDATEAIEALERVYRAARAWPELARVLELGAAESPDPEVRSARLKALGDVLESKLGDLRAAVATYERLTQQLPDDETLLGELARLTEKTGDVRSAVKWRVRLAEISHDAAFRARMHVIAGQLLVPIDPDAARAQFERAVDADPSNQSAWTALLWGARADNDVALAARYLEDRAQRTEFPRARAAAFAELAEHRARHGDEARAREAWEEAAIADPTNEAAANALVLAFVEEERWEEAEGLCDVAVAAAERDRDVGRIFTFRRAQALIARQLGRPDRALAAAKAAHEIRPEDLDATEAYIFAAHDMRADPQIFAVREPLVFLADHPDGLSVDARVALADVLVVTGDADRAACLYDDALAESPEDERALAGLAQHHTAQGNPVAAVSLKRQLALAVEDPEERFAALHEVAVAFLEKAGSEELAAETYEDARRVKPGDLATLHKLLALYQRLGKWAALYDVLRSIAEADSDPVRRTKTLYTMAELAKEELADRGTALALFEQALDVDPSHLVAFERIVRMLTEDRDWLGLEQMYKRMIERSLRGTDVTLQHALYKQLGLVYRDRLKVASAGIQCFQIAVKLKPDDEEGQTILRELLEREGQADSAVALTVERVLRDPLVPGPYPALFDLLMLQGHRDRALCVASAMNFLDVAHPAAQGLRASYPQPPIEGIVMELGADGYRALLHEELDPALTEIFEIVAPAVIDIGLSRLGIRDRLQYPGPALKGYDWLVKGCARAAAVLGLPAPRLFARRTPGPGLAVAATKPPSLLAYPQAFGGVASDAVAFVIGKRVVEISPPLLARALVPSLTELKALAQAAARIGTGQIEAADVALRDKLDRNALARLKAVVETELSRSGKLDVARWSRLADLSASRAGLLLAGDLEAARAAIALEGQLPGDLAPREKMKELLTWYLGDTCATLRRRLGVAL